MKKVREIAQAVVLLAWGACLASCDLLPSGPDVEWTLQLTPQGTAPAETALAETRETLADRLEQAGFRSPTVEPSGGGRVSVRLSHVKDPARIRRLIEANAVFELRLVRSEPRRRRRPSSNTSRGSCRQIWRSCPRRSAARTGRRARRGTTRSRSGR